MKRTVILRLLLLLCCMNAFGDALAQRYTSHPAGRYARTGKRVLADIEQKYTERLDSLVSRYNEWTYEGSDTLSNPYYAALFASPTLYTNVLKRSMTTASAPAQPSPLASSRKVYELTALSDSLLIATYALHPWLIRSEDDMVSTATAATGVHDIVRPDISLTETFDKDRAAGEPAAVTPDDDDWQIVVRRPNFWTVKTNFSLQFTQNYVSDNWYKGGESHNSLLAATVIEANYNNQQKVTFDNKLEMKLGFQTSHNDEEHKYKTNSDLLRLTNKLGLRAVKHWYYTVMLQSWTQFYKGYKSNDKKVYSDFMSPFESLLSVGMDYQLGLKKFTINATLSPIALKLKYVGRPSLETSFGLKEGHHAKWDYGSNITINYNWKIINQINWQGRIYYFTDYSKTQVEWENTFNFTINKYLSARLFLYPRFDASRNRKEGESYFQFNELLSLGLNVNF